MHEKKRRVRGELTAIGNGRLERALMSAEPLRPNGRKNLLASDPHYRPSKKSGDNAQNDSYHRRLQFISLKAPMLTRVMTAATSPKILPEAVTNCVEDAGPRPVASGS